MEEVFEPKPLPVVKLADGRDITLNFQQADALEKMKAWVQLPDDLFFTLSGYAGTGKSTISKGLISFYNEKYKWRRVCVSAPTHKARKVIKQFTREDSFTIQKLLGLRPNTDLENFDINNPQFDEKAIKEIRSFKLIILDEASMLNESLFDLLVKEATACKTKILFMGDQAQLPPVNEAISKVFTDIENTVNLTKVERQADGNPIMPVYDAIRSNIVSVNDMFEHKSVVNEKGEGVHFLKDQKEFEKEIFQLFSSDEYKKDPDHVKMICYMNKSVQAWNKAIRDHIVNKPEPLVVGEILMAYNSAVRAQVEVLIENSTDYVVESIDETVSNDGVDVYYCSIRSVDDKIQSEISIVKSSSVDRFLKKFNYLFNNAKSAFGMAKRIAWRRYYDFKNEHLLMFDVHDSSGKLLVKKDLDYGYAITVHKSQGSTFNYVGVSENNIDLNTNNTERNKLKYVALSRPRIKAIVFSKKAEP